MNLVWMAKKQFNFKDLTSKELELLKETYINLKVNSMSNDDLRKFAIENISIQIKNTIGNEEEVEAWQEMEEFFKDEFEITIKKIKNLMESKNVKSLISDDEQIKIESENVEETKKLDMWEDWLNLSFTNNFKIFQKKRPYKGSF